MGNVEACCIENFQLNFTRFLFKPERLLLINYFLFQFKSNFTLKLKATSVKEPPCIKYLENDLLVTACSYSQLVQEAFYSENKLH